MIVYVFAFLLIKLVMSRVNNREIRFVEVGVHILLVSTKGYLHPLLDF